MAKGKNHQPGGAAAVVEALVRPTVEGFGLRLWDVRFEKEGPDWFLRILIDRDEPLDTDTCEAVSRAIDPILDEADPIDQSYYLEVGSPGLGRRDAEGILEGLSADGMVTLKSDDGDYTFPVKAAGYVKLCDDEDLF